MANIYLIPKQRDVSKQKSKERNLERKVEKLHSMKIQMIVWQKIHIFKLEWSITGK